MRLRFHTWLCFLAGCAGVLAADRPPVLHFPFEGSLASRGSIDFDAKPYGDELFYEDGVAGRCIFLGGTGDWIDIAVDETLRLQRGATMAFWFKRDDWENPYRGGSGWQTIVHLDGLGVNVTAPGCPAHEPWAIEGSVERFTAEGGTASVTVRSRPGTVEPGTWYHVAVTYDAEAGRASLYVNGDMVESKDGAPVPTESPVNPLRLGTWFQSNQAFRGWIDELRVYDYPRSAEQVAAEAGW